MIRTIWTPVTFLALVYVCLFFMIRYDSVAWCVGGIICALLSIAASYFWMNDWWRFK